MTSFPDEQPLTRRELRERLRAQRAHDDALKPKTEDSEPASEVDATKASDTREPPPSAGTAREETAPSSAAGRQAEEQSHEPPPLTRRQARARARDAQESPQNGGKPHAGSGASEDSAADQDSVVPREAAAPEKSAPGEAEEVAASTEAAGADTDSSPHEEASSATAFGDTAAKKAPAQAFESLIAPEARPSDALTTSSALVLPGAGRADEKTPTTGDVLVTGSVDVHRSQARGSSAAKKERLETDDGADNGPESSETAGTPVSATKAVSTHSVTRDAITPQTRTSSSKLLMILAITAGVLCVAVIGVVIVGLMTGTF